MRLILFHYEKTPYQIEHRLLMPDGRIKYVLNEAKQSMIHPETLSSLGTVQDITEQKIAELSLKEKDLRTGRYLKAILTGL